jgi:thioredoxin-like negative regulator of GroEL
MTFSCLLRATIAVGALALLICQRAGAVDFHESIEAARASDTEQRPIVVSFGAAWCGWCRKMEAVTFQSPEVEEIAGKFLWVKVDVDEQKELAARFRAHGLPHTVVLDSKGRTIGAVGGYLPPERFVRFLTQSVTNPLPGVHQIDDLLEQLEQSETDDETRQVVTDLVTLVARPNREGRAEVLDAFKRRKSAVHSVLLDLLSDERLAIRAAAGQSLKHCLGAGMTFDPFADPATRAAQLAAWRKWASETAPPDPERK